MTVFLIFLFSTLVIIFFIYRLFLSLKKKDNPFVKFFLLTLILYGIGEVIGLGIITAYLYSNQAHLLYWLDVFSRSSTYLGSIFIIQIPLYLYGIKTKYRYIVSALFFISSLFFFLYNLSIRYQPFFDSTGAIHWEAPLTVSLGFALITLAAWVPTAIVFLLKSKKTKSKKFLLLGIGFFLTSIGTTLQDFSKSNFQFNLFYFFLFLGAVSIILGFELKEKTKVNK